MNKTIEIKSKKEKITTIKTNDTLCKCEYISE